MSQIPTIPKKITLPPAQDYTALRGEGLQYIESLASALWTDYNEHDPGITILEVLCYAITELGYRTDFDIKDLLTAAGGKIPDDQCFYTAKNILTVNPLTIRDHRKLLVDLTEVQNAWMITDYADVGQEVPFYADCEKDQLTMDDGTKPVPEDHRIRLSGLYKTVLDLEGSLEWGDLNNTGITWRIPEGDIQDEVVTILFHYLEQTAREDYNNIVAALTGPGYAAAIQQVVLPPRKTDLHHWECDITVQYQEHNVATIAVVKLIIRVDSLSGRSSLQKADTYLQALFTRDFIHDRFADYQSKYRLIQDTLVKAESVLLAHRNLCEDFKELVTVKDQDIAICMDIEVKPDADIEKISAGIFYYVLEYFSPSIRFYSLKELLARGNTVDAIFDGPVLSHGFIDNDELDAAQLRQVIRTSDLVNIIMGMEGVTAVKNLLLTKYDEDGEPQLPSEAWCLSIPAGYKPILNIDRSKIIYYKGKIPLKAKIAETLDTLQYLQAIHEKNKLYGAEDDLPVPVGNYYNLEDYYSVQNDLPETYGTGIAGLPTGAPDERRAQARQLKAYLLFYDQLLADFFSQLNGVKRLLSIDKTLVQTYFTQYLAEAAPPLYQDGVKGVTDIYINPAQVQSLMNGSQVSSPGWRNLVESEQVFYDRRNSFLDHLLARFATSFNDYVLMMYQVEFDLQQSEAISNSNILSAKIDFLQNYPDISSNRGRALNYCPLLIDPVTGLPVLDSVNHLPELDKAALWSPDNISGLEKRASLLTGIPLPAESQLAHFLFCHSIADITGQGTNNDPPYSFAFFDEKDQPLLVSVKKDYATESAAAADVGIVSKGLASTQYYYAQKQADDTYRLFVTDDPVNKVNLLATDGKSYATVAEANKAKNALAKYFSAGCDKEGFYIVEHILLRPRVIAPPASPFQLMEVCLGKDCHFCGEQDPYSFRASVVLPYWPGRFKNMIFRRYFEEIIQTEAPAPVSLKICWVNNTSMREFEAAYKAWLPALANYTIDPADNVLAAHLKDANDKLIYILQHLYSEYPVATLHDCEESADTNVVILGSTVLGTYKN